MIAKGHKTRDGRLILALCDSSLVGKKFEGDGLQLDLSSDFYKGEELDETGLIILVRKAYMISFAGKEAVDFGIMNGLVNKGSIVSIAGIPTAQVLI